MTLTERVRAAVLATVPITDVVLADETDKSTWTVTPASLQAAAQPIINAFDLSAIGLEQGDADADVDTAFDGVVGNIVEALLENFGAMQAEAQDGALRVSIWEQRLRRRAKVLRRAATST